MLQITEIFTLLLLFQSVNGDANAAAHCGVCICENYIMRCEALGLTKFPEVIDEGIKAVYMDNNSLSTVSQLPEESALQTLSLKHNGICNLTYDAFDNLDSLITLVLSYNNISTIADDIFEWNPLSLQVLELDHNRMEFIQHFLFYDLEQLTTLNLQNNMITFIHPHAFLQLKNLRNLRLDGNQLHTFNSKWIQKLESNVFNVLRFDNNSWSCDCAMEQAHNWLTEERKSKWFKDLTITHPIKCTQPVQFNGQAVEDLDLQRMKEVCEEPVIKGISASATIDEGRDVLLRCVTDKSKHPVATISWTAPNKDVYRLNTADNFEGIFVHQDGSLLIKNLSKPDAGDYTCEATNMKGNFAAKTTITVRERKILSTEATYTAKADAPDKDYIEKEVASNDCPDKCQCVSRHVDCAGDGIKGRNSLPNDIPPDALSIGFASNSLMSLGPNTFTRYVDLEELRLDDNHITTVDTRAFAGLSILSTLTLRKNELLTIHGGTFSPLKKLNVLVLDENKLTKLQDDTFLGLESVHWLYIRNNLIQTISDGAFKPLKEIRFIHLESNQLQVIYSPTIAAITIDLSAPTVNKIFVDDNPFNCDCKLESLRGIVRDTSIKKTFPNLFADGVVCSFPAEYSDHHLEDITKTLKCTESEEVKEILAKQDKEKESSYPGLLFGGIALGVILAAVLFFLWRKYGRRARTVGRSYNYSNLNGTDDAERKALTDNLGSSGTEAFV